jgi:hypothetical protein
MPEVQQENNPDTSLMLRVRTWRDVFPWLGVVDCLSGATSLVGISLVALAVAAAIGSNLLFYSLAPTMEMKRPTSVETSILDFRDWTPAESLSLVYGPAVRLVARPSMVAGGGPRSVAILLAHQGMLLLIWAIPAGYILRQSGLSMAGRDWSGTGMTASLILRRLPAFLGVAIIPFALLAGICLYFWVAAMTAKIPAVGQLLAGALNLLGLPLAIFGGVIAAGGFVAIPLGWAAVALEREGSAFDGISRGFEYVVRCILLWVVYGLIGAVILALLGLVARGVGRCAILLQTLFLPEGDLPVTASNLPAAWLIQSLPWVVELAVFWSLVAWMYLLLRQAANNQEPEDVWELPPAPPADLPTLQIDRGTASPTNDA